MLCYPVGGDVGCRGLLFHLLLFPDHGALFLQVTLKLQESQLPGPDQLRQFQVVCQTEEDKFLLLYALLKLSLVRGKSLLFVNTLDRSYRLRLFLEQFSIPTCVLNGELPLCSRCTQPDPSAETREGAAGVGVLLCLQRQVEARLWARLILADFLCHGSGFCCRFVFSSGAEARRLHRSRAREEGRVGTVVVMMSEVGGGLRMALAAEPPSFLACRCHIISQFNQGFYDCVIATDAEVLGAPVKGKRRGRGSKGDR